MRVLFSPFKTTQQYNRHKFQTATDATQSRRGKEIFSNVVFLYGIYVIAHCFYTPHFNMQINSTDYSALFFAYFFRRDARWLCGDGMRISSSCVFLVYLPNEGVPRRLLLCFSIPANAKTILSSKKLPQVILKLFIAVAVKLSITHSAEVWKSTTEWENERNTEETKKPDRLCTRSVQSELRHKPKLPVQSNWN